MLHPNQFQVNEAWILFQLNEEPIQVASDGAFNCLALMDAASCFILTSELVSANTEPSKADAKRMLRKAHSHKQQMPKTLFIPNDFPANNLALEAENQNVTVVRIPEHQLRLMIGEAREAFKEHFGSRA
jgi:hypothetical protein